MNSIIADIITPFNQQRSQQLECDYETSATKLILKIESGEWKSCIRRVKTHPLEVRTWIRRNNDLGEQIWMVLPIHAAITSDAPVSVIRALLEAYPNGAKENDDMKNLPLHLATNKFNPDDDVILALLEYNPDSIYVENLKSFGMAIMDYDLNFTLLFDLVQRKEWDSAISRVKECPLEVRTWIMRREEKNYNKVRWRLLPIHAALIFKAPAAVLEAFLTSFPKSALCSDDEGMIPLQREMKRRTPSRDAIIALTKAMINPETFIRYSKDQAESMEKRGMRLLHAYYHKDEDPLLTTSPKLYKLIEDEDWTGATNRLCTNPEEAQTWITKYAHDGSRLHTHLPLHLALTITNTPINLIEALITIYKDALRCFDDKDMLPLQLALRTYQRSDPILDTMAEMMEHPTNACMKDAEGETFLTNYDLQPMELYRLIESLSWPDVISHVRDHPKEASVWVLRKHSYSGTIMWRHLPIHTAIMHGAPCSVVKSLLKAYREGAKCRDEKNMLPLQLARRKKARQDVIQCLIRAYPEGANEMFNVPKREQLSSQVKVA